MVVLNNLQRFDFDGPRYLGFDGKNILIEYAAEQYIDFAGALDEYSALVEKYSAVIVFDNGHRK